VLNTKQGLSPERAGWYEYCGRNPYQLALSGQKGKTPPIETYTSPYNMNMDT